MITTNNILMILILMCWSNILLSQIDFTRNLYCKIVFDEIEIKDSNKAVVNQNELFNIFYRKDTATNCFGELVDKFHDNIYYDPQFILFLTEYEFDTLTNPHDSKFIDFFRIIRSEMGDLIEKIFSFSLKKDLMNESKKITNGLKNDSRFLNNDDEFWAIKKIENGDRLIYLDDCHKQYRLNFTNNQIFNQIFQNNQIQCIDIVDLNKIVEQKKMLYWHNKVYHDISISKGRWKTKNNKLYMINENADLVKEISYEFHKNTLILFNENKYKIELEKIKTLKNKK